MMADDLDEIMPIWLPPSPPESDADFDLRMEDDAFDLLYELDPMNETRLPQNFHDWTRRPLAEKQKQQVTLNDIHLQPKEKDPMYDAVARCLQMPSNDQVAASPAYTENSFSMDDTSQEAKIEPIDVAQPQVPVTPTVQQPKPSKRKRPENKQSANRTGESAIERGTTPPPAVREEPDYDGADWNIVEDHALLHAVQIEFSSMHRVERTPLKEGMLFNWEFVAHAVNKQTRFYRSARQCSIRYQRFVRPKEKGELVASDPITKKNQKVELSTVELAHLRKGRISTTSQYNHDYGNLTDKKHVNRFKTVKQVAARRQVQFWRGPRGLESRNLQSLAGGMPLRHEQKIAEFDVKPGALLDVEDVVTLNEEQIAIIEAKKKQPPGKPPKPTPRVDYRFHTLVLRPYTVPLCSQYEPMPARRDMRVAIPPLTPVPPPAPRPPSCQPPPPQYHHHQQPQQPNQQQKPPTPTQHIQLPPLQSSLQSQNQSYQVQNAGGQGQMMPQQPMTIRQVGSTGSMDGGLGQGQNQGHGVPQGATIQRRTASGSNVQYLPPPPTAPGGQSYMVVPSTGEGGTQRVQYVHQRGTGGQGGGYGGNTLVMRGNGRVVRQAGGNMPQRVYLDRQYTVPSNVVPVRVMPTNQQQQRMIGGQGSGGGQRRPPPAPGTVAAMVLPARNNPGVPMRQIQRGGGYPNQRINVMVQSQGGQGQGQGHLRGQGLQGGQGMGGGPMRRQLVSRQIPRHDPTVAQVVVAPPSGMNTGPPVLHMQRGLGAPPQQPHGHSGSHGGGHSQAGGQGAPPQGPPAPSVASGPPGPTGPPVGPPSHAGAPPATGPTGDSSQKS